MSPRLDQRLPCLVAVAVVVAAGGSPNACAGELATAPGDPPGAVTPSRVLAHAESFLGKKVQVRGRIHVEKYETAEPCNPVTGTGCISPAYTSLHVVTVGEPRRDTNSLDLYRPAAQGGEEPLRCRVIRASEFDCGAYKPDAVAVVSGRVVKHRVPTQQVGHPDGRVEVIQYREISVLLVQP